MSDRSWNNALVNVVTLALIAGTVVMTIIYAVDLASR